MSGAAPAPATALVTGSAKGIGRALVLALAGDGCDVAVHYRSSRDAAEAVAAEVRALGRRAVTLRADVTDAAQAEGLVREAEAALGGLDVLVNNVGDYAHGPFSELTVETWRAMFDSNLHSAFYTCRAALPGMRERGFGRIVNLGYAGAEHLVARPGIAPYAIAKTGVILLTKTIARSEAANGITANAVSPGVMENSVTKPMRELPTGRTGRLDELASAVRWLVSPAAAYTTGVHVEVAGGWNV